MFNSLLGATFVEILKNEWLGIIASAFILISFLTNNQVKTRIINLVGCAVFVVYGFVLPAYSTALMNAALVVVHIVFLAKDFAQRHKNKSTTTFINEQSVSSQKNIANDASDTSSADEKGSFVD